MAQVDKLNYLPLLFWFVLLFVAIYIVILTRFLPMLYSMLKTRRLFFSMVFNRIKKYSSSLFFTHYVLLKLVYLSYVQTFSLKLLNSRQAVSNIVK